MLSSSSRAIKFSLNHFKKLSTRRIHNTCIALNNSDINDWIEKSLKSVPTKEAEGAFDLGKFGGFEDDEDLVFGISPNKAITKSKIDDGFRERSKYSEGSLKEKEVFDEIFHSILSKNQSKKQPEFQSSSSSRNSKAISDQVHAVFMKVFQNDKQKGSVSLASEDIRHTPLSVSSKLYSRKETLETFSESKKKMEQENVTIKQYLEPTFKYLDENFKTNTELLIFLEENVIMKFLNKDKKPDIDLSLKPSKDTKSKRVELLSSIKIQSEKNPAEPLITELTLPILINRIIHQLTFEFRSPSDSIAIFNTLKKDLNLYAHGCNTETYNEMLITMWIYYKNIYSVENLILEMNNNGIIGNFRSFGILETILKDCYSMFRGNAKENLNPLYCPDDALRARKIESYLKQVTEGLKSSLV